MQFNEAVRTVVLLDVQDEMESVYWALMLIPGHAKGATLGLSSTARFLRWSFFIYFL